MNYEFEHESSLDGYHGQNPTNFDLCISGESTKLLFEVKYTEEGFGGIEKKKMATYVEKYDNLYKKLALKVISCEWNNCESFIENYQIMRNLVHIDESSYLIFLYPELNVTVKNQAVKAREFVKPEFRAKLICMTWETLYQQMFNILLEVDTMDCFLEQSLLEFRDKYLYWIDIPKCYRAKSRLSIY
jgi:adenine-specific DNA methylase